MKLPKKQKKSILVIIAVVILTLVVGYLSYAYYSKNWPFANSSTSQKEPSSDEIQAKSLRDDPSNKLKNTNSDKPAEPTLNEKSDKKQVAMTASTDSSNGFIFLRGRIGYPVVDGACYAVLSGPSNQSIRKDTAILQNPASTDCKTISIPAGELTPGKWTFILRYVSDGYEGASNEVSFSV